MMRLPFALLIASMTCPLAAQVFPVPGMDTPRVQTVQWRAGEPVVLTALPGTTLTTMLEPGETIQRVVVGGDRGWQVSVSSEADSFQITPQSGALPTLLTIETDARIYEFALETGDGLQAAYLVRIEYGPSQPVAIAPEIGGTVEGLDWNYRIRGDRSVRPLSVRDNGEKTVIEYSPEQALPAVFAIGPTGDEEVVDGYMRDGRFVIDRVHQELVFRIDKEKATAERKKENGGEQ